MNWDIIKGDWRQFRGKVKKHWSKLGDDDLDMVDGQRDQLIGRIQERYGIVREEAEKEVRAWEGRE